MTADRPVVRRRAPATALVVELGRSRGSMAVAAGIALARAHQTADGGWVLLAELDARGGDLLERLTLGSTPRAGLDGRLPAGARQLAERLAGAELEGVVGDGLRATPPALTDYLVEVAGVRGLRVLLGDHLVGGAAMAGPVIGPRLSELAGLGGADAVVIDGGPWTSAEPDRLAGVHIVYAVIEASSASQNARCLAELSAMWRLLGNSATRRRLVAVVVDPIGDPQELRDLFEGETSTTGQHDRHRVVMLAGRRQRRLLRELAAGRWSHLSPKVLAAFVDLASPIDEPLPVRPVVPSSPSSSPQVAVDEHAYLTAVTRPSLPVAPVGDRPQPDPEFWPFEDGEGLPVEPEAPSQGGPPDAGRVWAETKLAEDPATGCAEERRRRLSPAVRAALQAQAGVRYGAPSGEWPPLHDSTGGQETTS